MAYAPPSGWVETRRPDNEDDPMHVRFHSSTDCVRILEPDTLRKVDKPYSATRCMLCASELNEPTAYTARDRIAEPVSA